MYPIKYLIPFKNIDIANDFLQKGNLTFKKYERQFPDPQFNKQLYQLSIFREESCQYIMKRYGKFLVKINNLTILANEISKSYRSITQELLPKLDKNEINNLQTIHKDITYKNRLILAKDPYKSIFIRSKFENNDDKSIEYEHLFTVAMVAKNNLLTKDNKEITLKINNIDKIFDNNILS